MSVINKVLKDLDKRQQSVTADEVERVNDGFIAPQIQYTSELQSTSGATTALKPSNTSVMIAIVMLIAMSILGYMLYQQGRQLQRLQPLAENKATETNNIVEKTVSETESVSLNIEEPLVVKEAGIQPVIVSSDLEIVRVNDDTVEVLNIEENDAAIANQQADNEQIDDTTSSILVASTASASNATKDKVKKADVQVRFTQSTRPSNTSSTTSSQVRQTSTQQFEEVKVTNIQPKTVTSANEKGHMAVKEVVLTNEELAKKKFDAAEIAEQQQKIDKAIKNYYEALILQPSLHQARKQLAALYYSVNNLGRAEQILAQGTILFPDEVELVVLKAKVENAGFSPDKALNTLKGIDDNSEWARDKWILQSDIAQNNGQFELAESAYRSLLTVEPSQARWWMGLAYALDSQQQYSQAADAYRKAMSYRGLSTGAMTYIEQRLIQLGGSQ